MLDATNVVAACRPCNDLFNHDKAPAEVPSSLAAFYALRDETFVSRRARILARLEAERTWFEEHVRPR